MIYGFGELDRTVTVDPIVVNGQTVGDAGVITGDKPPIIPPSWWPWIIAGGVLAVTWWLNSDDDDDDQEEGRLDDRPLDA